MGKGIMQDIFQYLGSRLRRERYACGDEAKIRRSKDGTYAKKGTKSYFGYKVHGAMDEDYCLMKRIEVHLLIFMIFRWIWPKKAKFAIQIKDIWSDYKRI